MIYKIRLFLVVLLFFSISFIAFGDDPNPPVPPPCPTTPDPPVGTPIEDGSTILLGLGLIYGVYLVQRTKRKLIEDQKE